MKSSRILAAICAASAVALAPHAALAQDDSVEAAAPAAIEPQVRTRDMVGMAPRLRSSFLTASERPPSPAVVPAPGSLWDHCL